MKHIIKLEDTNKGGGFTDGVSYIVTGDSVDVYQTKDGDLFYTESEIYTQNGSRFFSFEIEDGDLVCDDVTGETIYVLPSIVESMEIRDDS